MKTEIIINEQARRVPEVGEVFGVGSDPCAYLRCRNSIGNKVFGDTPGTSWIYGYRLNDADLCRFRPADFFTILQPVGGVAKFEMARCNHE